MLTDFRTELMDLIETAFAVDPGDPPLFEKIHDGRLPRLMGADGNYCGVSPESQTPTLNQGLDQQTQVLVQFYMKYEKTKPIDPTLVLSPKPAEEVVERFQRAVQDAIGSNSTGARWFYNVSSIDYPPDPVGQRTRAEVRVTAHGNNPALLETTP